MNHKWTTINSKAVTSVEEIVAVLLENRNIVDSKDFFNPAHPATISLTTVGISEKEIKKAVKRIRQAIESREQIVIFGDYDVDGVCSTSLTWKALSSLGASVMPFVPNRFTDGYGMKPKTVDAVLQKYPDTKLIISVDNGIVAHEALSFAKEKGVDVIVTDHHEKNGEVDCFALIHTTKICGTGIAWFLVRELLEKGKADSFLDLVGLATIADQMPLVNENRSLVSWGLKEINETKNPGLQALLSVSNLQDRIVGVYEVGFVIAPRINAAGRISDATEAVRLLCSNSIDRVASLAKALDETNKQRQDIVSEVLFDVEKIGNLSQTIIVVSGETFHEGVIGLAAAKLVEKYGLPAIVFSVGKTHAKASARSIKGLHITELIRSIPELVVEGGGHEMAAGFSVKTENIDAFRIRIEELAGKLITDEMKQKKLSIDAEIPLALADFALLDALEKFSPYGIGNPHPTFVTHGVHVASVKKIGSDMTHLKLVLFDGKRKIDAVFWGGAAYFDTIGQAQDIDVVFNVSENEWNGRKSVQLMIKDLRKTEYDKQNISGSGTSY
jgi:single-stranded-DNA-specific exonuclease